MSASKKDYVAIARIIEWEYKQAMTPEHRNSLHNIAKGLAAHFARNGNGRFDRGRFMDACGVNK